MPILQANISVVQYVYCIGKKIMNTSHTECVRMGAGLQRVHEFADVWDITFRTRIF